MKQYMSILTRSWYINLKSSPFPSCQVSDHLNVLCPWNNSQKWDNKSLCPSSMCLLHDPMAIPWGTMVGHSLWCFLGHSSNLHIISLFQLQDSFWLHVKHVNHMLSCHVGWEFFVLIHCKSTFFMNMSHLFPVNKKVISNFLWNTFF